jgi:hypothetical protein
MHLTDGRETMDDIRRDVQENGDDAHPDNVAWVDAQNMHLADGCETMDDIRRDVRENGDDAHPDNVAWIDAQNNCLAEIGKEGRNTKNGNCN